MNMHQQFDMSFISSSLAPLFENLQVQAGAGLVEAVNCEALSPAVQRLYLRAARERILAVKREADALLAKLPQVEELLEEQALEVAS